MAFIFCFLNQFFFRGRREGGEGELQQRSVLLSTTHCSSHVCYISLHIRESKTVLDSGFHDTDSGLQVLDSSICQWNLDSGLQSLEGFRIRWAVFRIPLKPRITDYGFHKQKFIGFPYLGRYMHHTAVIYYRARKVNFFNTVWLPEGIVLLVTGKHSWRIHESRYEATITGGDNFKSRWPFQLTNRWHRSFV